MKIIALIIIIIPGLVFIFKPATIIHAYSKWYSLFGMKVDKNHWFWKEKIIQSTGVIGIVISIIITLLSTN